MVLPTNRVKETLGSYPPSRNSGIGRSSTTKLSQGESEHDNIDEYAVVADDTLPSAFFTIRSSVTDNNLNTSSYHGVSDNKSQLASHSAQFHGKPPMNYPQSPSNKTSTRYDRSSGHLFKPYTSTISSHSSRREREDDQQSDEHVVGDDKQYSISRSSTGTSGRSRFSESTSHRYSTQSARPSRLHVNGEPGGEIDDILSSSVEPPDSHIFPSVPPQRHHSQSISYHPSSRGLLYLPSQSSPSPVHAHGHAELHAHNGKTERPALQGRSLSTYNAIDLGSASEDFPSEGRGMPVHLSLQTQYTSSHSSRTAMDSKSPRIPIVSAPTLDGVRYVDGNREKSERNERSEKGDKSEKNDKGDKNGSNMSSTNQHMQYIPPSLAQRFTTSGGDSGSTNPTTSTSGSNIGPSSSAGSGSSPGTDPPPPPSPRTVPPRPIRRSRASTAPTTSARLPQRYIPTTKNNMIMFLTSSLGSTAEKQAFGRLCPVLETLLTVIARRFIGNMRKTTLLVSLLEALLSATSSPYSLIPDFPTFAKIPSTLSTVDGLTLASTSSNSSSNSSLGSGMGGNGVDSNMPSGTFATSSTSGSTRTGFSISSLFASAPGDSVPFPDSYPYLQMYAELFPFTRQSTLSEMTSKSTSTSLVQEEYSADGIFAAIALSRTGSTGTGANTTSLTVSRINSVGSTSSSTLSVGNDISLTSGSSSSSSSISLSNAVSASASASASGVSSLQGSPQQYRYDSSSFLPMNTGHGYGSAAQAFDDSPPPSRDSFLHSLHTNSGITAVDREKEKDKETTSIPLFSISSVPPRVFDNFSQLQVFRKQHAGQLFLTLRAHIMGYYTALFELLSRTGFTPLFLQSSDYLFLASALPTADVVVRSEDSSLARLPSMIILQALQRCFPLAVPQNPLLWEGSPLTAGRYLVFSRGKHEVRSESLFLLEKTVLVFSLFIAFLLHLLPEPVRRYVGVREWDYFDTVPIPASARDLHEYSIVDMPLAIHPFLGKKTTNYNSNIPSSSPSDGRYYPRRSWYRSFLQLPLRHESSRGRNILTSLEKSFRNRTRFFTWFFSTHVFKERHFSEVLVISALESNPIPGKSLFLSLASSVVQATRDVSNWIARKKVNTETTTIGTEGTNLGNYHHDSFSNSTLPLPSSVNSTCIGTTGEISSGSISSSTSTSVCVSALPSTSVSSSPSTSNTPIVPTASIGLGSSERISSVMESITAFAASASSIGDNSLGNITSTTTIDSISTSLATTSSHTNTHLPVLCANIPASVPFVSPPATCSANREVALVSSLNASPEVLAHRAYRAAVYSIAASLSSIASTSQGFLTPDMVGEKAAKAAAMACHSPSPHRLTHLITAAGTVRNTRLVLLKDIPVSLLAGSLPSAHIPVPVRPVLLAACALCVVLLTIFLVALGPTVLVLLAQGLQAVLIVFRLLISDRDGLVSDIGYFAALTHRGAISPDSILGACAVDPPTAALAVDEIAKAWPVFTGSSFMSVIWAFTGFAGLPGLSETKTVHGPLGNSNGIMNGSHGIGGSTTTTTTLTDMSNDTITTSTTETFVPNPIATLSGTNVGIGSSSGTTTNGSGMAGGIGITTTSSTLPTLPNLPNMSNLSSGIQVSLSALISIGSTFNDPTDLVDTSSSSSSTSSSSASVGSKKHENRQLEDRCGPSCVAMNSVSCLCSTKMMESLGALRKHAAALSQLSTASQQSLLSQLSHLTLSPYSLEGSIAGSGGITAGVGGSGINGISSSSSSSFSPTSPITPVAPNRFTTTMHQLAKLFTAQRLGEIPSSHAPGTTTITTATVSPISPQSRMDSHPHTHSYTYTSPQSTTLLGGSLLGFPFYVVRLALWAMAYPVISLFVSIFEGLRGFTFQFWLMRIPVKIIVVLPLALTTRIVIHLAEISTWLPEFLSANMDIRHGGLFFTSISFVVQLISFLITFLLFLFFLNTVVQIHFRRIRLRDAQQRFISSHTVASDDLVFSLLQDSLVDQETQHALLALHFLSKQKLTPDQLSRMSSKFISEKLGVSTTIDMSRSGGIEALEALSLVTRNPSYGHAQALRGKEGVVTALDLRGGPSSVHRNSASTSSTAITSPSQRDLHNNSTYINSQGNGQGHGHGHGHGHGQSADLNESVVSVLPVSAIPVPIIPLSVDDRLWYQALPIASCGKVLYKKGIKLIFDEMPPEFSSPGRPARTGLGLGAGFGGNAGTGPSSMTFTYQQSQSYQTQQHQHQHQHGTPVLTHIPSHAHVPRGLGSVSGSGGELTRRESSASSHSPHPTMVSSHSTVSWTSSHSTSGDGGGMNNLVVGGPVQPTQGRRNSVQLPKGPKGSPSSKNTMNGNTNGIASSTSQNPYYSSLHVNDAHSSHGVFNDDSLYAYKRK